MANANTAILGMPAMFRRVSGTNRKGGRPRVSNRRGLGLEVRPPAPDLSGRAAQYLRMSTDHQNCTIDRQRDSIASYAAGRGLEIVRTYADEGRSGLTLDGRPGLSALLEDVAAHRADFGIVLVYDVSRWGRFQDADESAFYEFICRCAGIRVEYCMEPFHNDGSSMSTIMKGLKRVMAGEYSRDLSQRVFAAKCRVVRQGYHQGGIAPYGLRRMAVTTSGEPRGVLEFGEFKARQADRVVLVHGPAEEREVLQWMFEEVAAGRMSPTDIARSLNQRKVPRPGGKLWTADRVQQILRNPKYIGRMIYNRISMKLKTRPVLNPVEQWITVDNAVEPLIDNELFFRVQRVMSTWSTRIDNATALRKLAALYKRKGTLSQRVIDEARGMPGSHFYDSRFGGLVNAFRLVGFTPARDYGFLEGNKGRQQMVRTLRQDVEAGLRELGVEVGHATNCIMTLNNGVRATVMLGRCRRVEGIPRWQVQVQLDRRIDWVVVARLDPENQSIQDYWLVEAATSLVTLAVKHRTKLRRERFADLPSVLRAVRDLAVAGLSPGGEDRKQPKVQNLRFAGE